MHLFMQFSSVVALFFSSSPAHASPTEAATGLGATPQRWAVASQLVLVGTVEATLPAVVSTGGLFSPESYTQTDTPSVLLRVRVHVDDAVVGRVEQDYVEIWLAAGGLDGPRSLGLAAGDRVVFGARLWDLRSAYGDYRGELGAPVYAAEGVGVYPWQLMLVDERDHVYTQDGDPVCVPSTSEVLLARCDGAEGDLLEAVVARIAAQWSGPGAVLPGVP